MFHVRVHLLYSERVGELREPVAKKARLDNDENSEEEEGDTMELSSERGDGLGVPMVVEAGQQLTDTAQADKKASQIRAGKTPEERQRLFKEMLLERGVSDRFSWLWEYTFTM